MEGEPAQRDPVAPRRQQLQRLLHLAQRDPEPAHRTRREPRHPQQHSDIRVPRGQLGEPLQLPPIVHIHRHPGRDERGQQRLTLRSGHLDAFGTEPGLGRRGQFLRGGDIDGDPGPLGGAQERPRPIHLVRVADPVSRQPPPQHRPQPRQILRVHLREHQVSGEPKRSSASSAAPGVSRNARTSGWILAGSAGTAAVIPRFPRRARSRARPRAGSAPGCSRRRAAPRTPGAGCAGCGTRPPPACPPDPPRAPGSPSIPARR